MAVTQLHYRIRLDDTQTANSNSGWAAALDTAATVDLETQFGVRVELEETAGVSTGSVQYKWQWRRQPFGGSFGSWTDLRTEVNIGEGGSATAVVCAGLSAGTSDGVATTNVLAGSAKSFVAGSVDTGGALLGSATTLTSAVTLNNTHTEFEVRGRIHKFSDGLVEVKVGDVFQFRLVTSAGATLDSYAQTPQVTVGASVGIIGGTWVESPNRIGPWEDDAGTLYGVFEWAVTDNQVILVSSDDGGDTWVEAQPTNRPGASIDDIESADARLVDDVLHIAIQGPSGDDVFYLKYNTSAHPSTPDTWVINNEVVDVTLNPAHQNAAIEVRSDGTIIVAYCEVVGGVDHIAYKIRASGGGWGAEQVINSGDGLTYNHVVLCKEAGTDKTWIFYWSADGRIRYRTIGAGPGNTLSGETVLETGLATTGRHANPILTPLSYTSGGAEIVLAGWKGADDKIHTVQFTNGVAGTEQVATPVVEMSAGTSHQPIAGWALDGTVCHLFFADATFDVFHVERPHGGDWSTPAEVLDGVTAHWIRPEQVTGGVGMLWDNGSDGGTGFTRYHLYPTSGGGGTDPDFNWYPGYYVLTTLGASSSFKQSVVDDPATDPFTGYQFRYLWADCESTQGVYTDGFNAVDADLARVAAKGSQYRMVVMLQYKTFDGSFAVPSYVRTEAAYESSNGSYTGEVVYDGDTHHAMVWNTAVNARIAAWITAMVDHIEASAHVGIVAAVVFNETSAGDPDTPGHMDILLDADYEANAYAAGVQANLLAARDASARWPSIYYHQGGFFEPDGSPAGGNEMMGDWLITQQYLGAGTPDAKCLNKHPTTYVLRDVDYQPFIASMPNIQANDYGVDRNSSLQCAWDYMTDLAPDGLGGHFLVFSYADTPAASPAFTFDDVSAWIAGHPVPRQEIPEGWVTSGGGGGGGGGGGSGGSPQTAAPSVTPSTANTNVKTVTIPAHDAGDGLLLVHGWYGGSTSTITSITAVNSVAWTMRNSSADGQSLAVPALCVAYLKAGSNQATSTSVTVTQSGNGRSISHVHKVTGAHDTTPPEFAYANVLGATWDPAALDPAAWDVENTLWLVGVVMKDNTGAAAITSTPAGYASTITNMLLGTTQNAVNVATAWRSATVAVEDPGAGANSEGQQTLMYTIGFRPVPPVGGGVPPTVNAGADVTGHTVGTQLSRTASENDGGLTIVTRQWTIQSGPAGVGSTIGTAAALSWTPTVVGSYTLQYEASNSAGSDADEMTVEVVAESEEPPPSPPPSQSPDDCDPASTVELFVNGAWTNITNLVYHRDQTVLARGRREGADTSDPASCDLVLNNDDGRFSHRNPTGPYYGQLTRNTPLRTTVYTGLRAAVTPPDGKIAAPHVAAFAVTGDLDIRVDAEVPHWRQERALAGRYEATGNHRSWAVYVDDDATVWLLTSPDGTLSSRLAFNSRVPMPVTGGRHAVRVTIDVNNGSGGTTVTWYTAPTIAGPWTLLASNVYAGTTSVHGGTAPLEVGAIPDLALDSSLDGRVYGFQLYNGIAGTLVADLDTTLDTTDETVVVDGEGNTWTATGGGLFTRGRARFHGEVAAWPQTWDDNDRAVRVTIEAAGVLRRIRQSDAAESTLRRGILETADVVAYWPGEDEGDATHVGAALDHRPLAVVTGAVPEFASDTSFVASKPLPTMNDAEVRAPLPAYDHNTGELQARMLVAVPEGGTTTGQTIMYLYTNGSSKRWEVAYGTGGDLRLRAYDEDDAEIVNTGFIAFGLDGTPVMLHLGLDQNGANIDWEVTTLAPGAASASTFTGTLNSHTFGRLWQLSINPDGGHQDVAFGHVYVANRVTSVFDVADQLIGYAGETAADRFLRLCDEAGFAARVVGAAADTEVMGPQRPLPLGDLLDEVELADHGFLVESRDRLGLNYRTRRSLYNQVPVVTVDYCDVAHGGPLQPVDDDAAIRNDVTVTRTDGSSARAVQTSGVLSVQPPPDGAGRYTTDSEINVAWDQQLEDHAGWLLNLGTVDEPRYPELPFRMLNPVIHGDAALLTAMLAVDVGDRVQIVNVAPVWLSPDDIDQIVEGTSETYSDFVDLVWDVTFRAQPASPYKIAVYSDEDSEGGDRYGGGWSALSSSVDAADTTLSVATSRGPLWTTDDAETPFDIVVGGEVITVTDIAGASSPQTFTVTRSVNGVAVGHAAGAAVELVDAAVRGL